MTESDEPKTDPLLELSDLIEGIWVKRQEIVRTTFFSTLLAVVIAMVLPKSYVTSTSILPDLDFISSFRGRLAGLSDLAGELGLSSGAGLSPSQLYPEILTSETVLRKVIDHRYVSVDSARPQTLLQFWEYDGEDPNLDFESCVRHLREDVISVSVDRRTTIITVTVEMPHPGMAAEVANQLAAELEMFQQRYRRSSANDQRRFLEQRLSEVSREMATAEDSLRGFKERNRQIAQSPLLTLELTRLERNVAINSAIFIELRKQYEMAKLDEVRNTQVVSVLDAARPPAKKDKPRRTMIVLVVFVLSFLLSAAKVVVQQKSSAWVGSSPGAAKLRMLINDVWSSVPRILRRQGRG
jgi:uncharacterized protein involved in exopolysaccharide biosynthesis